MAEKKGGMLNASARDGVKYRKATWVELIFGQFNQATGMCFYLMMIWASFIGPQGYAVPNLIFGTLSMVMRIFDGATDAIIATLFEKMSPKLPKIRIFLISGWAMAAFAILLMYKWAAGHFTGVMGAVVFVAIWVLELMGYTINGMGGGTVGTVMTNDPTQRPIMGLVNTILAYSIPLVLGNITAFFVLPKHNNQYDLACLGDLAICYAVVGGICVVIACFALGKVDTPETWITKADLEDSKPEEGKKKSSGISFKDIAAVLTSNRETQMYMLTCISDKFAQQMGTQAVITTLMSGILIGSYQATQGIANITTPFGMICAFGGAMYVAKMGSKKSTILWSWVAIALGALSTVFCVVLGPKGMQSIGKMGAAMVIWCILSLAFTGVRMMLTLTGNTMRADVVDYELSRSGNYFPAVLGGVYNFVDKLTNSVCALIAAGLIVTIGYTGTKVPQQGDPATWGVLIVAVGVTNILPIIGWLLNVIAMKFYSLDREKMIEVAKTCAEMREKKAANMAKAE